MTSLSNMMMVVRKRIKDLVKTVVDYQVGDVNNDDDAAEM